MEEAGKSCGSNTSPTDLYSPTCLLPINGFTVRALIDTNADVSLISKSLQRILGLRAYKNSPLVVGDGAHGYIEKLTQWTGIDLELKNGALTISWSLPITKNLRSHLLIGTDFMNAMGARLDLSRHRFTVMGTEFVVNMCDTPTYARDRTCLTPFPHPRETVVSGIVQKSEGHPHAATMTNVRTGLSPILPQESDRKADNEIEGLEMRIREAKRRRIAHLVRQCKIEEEAAEQAAIKAHEVSGGPKKSSVSSAERTLLKNNEETPTATTTCARPERPLTPDIRFSSSDDLSDVPID